MREAILKAISPVRIIEHGDHVEFRHTPIQEFDLDPDKFYIAMNVRIRDMHGKAITIRNKYLDLSTVLQTQIKDPVSDFTKEIQRYFRKEVLYNIRMRSSYFDYLKENAQTMFLASKLRSDNTFMEWFSTMISSEGNQERILIMAELGRHRGIPQNTLRSTYERIQNNVRAAREF